METAQTAPFGAWRSPVTSDLIVSKTVRLAEPWLAGDNVYWLEMRPEEQGRYVVVRCSADGRTKDLIPAPFNARTRVHEYGGASYVLDKDRVLFSNFADQRIYAVPCTGPAEPLPITAEGPYRYADAVIDAGRGRLVCVREDHSDPDGEPVNTLVGVDLEGPAGHGQVLVSGADFYAAPRLSPDGRRLAWLCWNHPDMPWDGTELWVADLDPSGVPRAPQRIAGGREESVIQPVWGADGLYFLSDRSGWWNLYRWRGGRGRSGGPAGGGDGRAALALRDVELCLFGRQGRSSSPIARTAGAAWPFCAPTPAFWNPSRHHTPRSPTCGRRGGGYVSSAARRPSFPPS